MARLEYIDNAGDNTVLNLVNGMSISIGRNPGSAIYTSNPSVSRNHGRITQEDGGWFVKDLGSSNGTYINDSNDRVEHHVLSSEDKVRCGDFVIHFVDDDSSVDERISQSLPDPFADSNDEVQLDPDQFEAKKTLRPRRVRRTRHDRDIQLEDSRPQARKRTKSKGKPAPRQRDPEPIPEAIEIEDGPSELEEKLTEQIKDQAAEIETLREQLEEYHSMVDDLELKLEDLENKNLRYDLELDSITEKYVQIKDQLTLSKERLDESREECAERDDEVFQLKTRLTEMETELEAAREKATTAHEAGAELKIKATQKDRQIEELQRQLDLMEFEFRAAKEELQALQDEHNTGAGDTQKLERKINQLREIIADKENVVSELRLETENKDIEIRQVRMGMGMTDLEDEKRKLLQDYYDKNREVDLLKDDMKTVERDKQELDLRVKELETTLEKKSASAADITGHPDFKAKSREIKRLEEQLGDLEADLRTASDQLESFSPEEKKRLQGELAFFKRKNATLEDKLSDAKEKLEQPKGEEPASEQAAADVSKELRAEAHLDAIRSSLEEQLEEIFDTFSQFRGNFSLFKTYLKELSTFVGTLPADGEGLPDEVKTLMQESSPSEAIDSVQDLLRVVNSDAKALKQGLSKIKSQLGE